MSLNSIPASEEGAKKKRAEFTILELLLEEGGIDCDEIDETIKEIHTRLKDTNAPSPFTFRVSGSNGPQSRELDESLDRLLLRKKITLTEENDYHITDRGQEYLRDETKLERDGVSDAFQKSVGTILEEFL